MDKRIVMTLEDIAEGLANHSISLYRNNPKANGKAVRSLLYRPIIEGALAGIVFYQRPGGTYIIVDGNTRMEYLPQRLDWNIIKHTEVAVHITDNWDEAKQIINIKQKGVRGRAPNSELALNTDFPCGKFLADVKRDLRGMFADKAELVTKHIEKAPQHIFDTMNHIKDHNSSVSICDYNKTRAHAPATSAFVDAGPEEHYSKYITPEWRERITGSLAAYINVLACHELHQSSSLDRLLGVGKGAVNPGFWVAFMLDRMSGGQGSLSGFSFQSPKKLLQHLRANGNASELWLPCSELLRSQPSVPRTELASLLRKCAYGKKAKSARSGE